MNHAVRVPISPSLTNPADNPEERSSCPTQSAIRTRRTSYHRAKESVSKIRLRADNGLVVLVGEAKHCGYRGEAVSRVESTRETPCGTQLGGRVIAGYGERPECWPPRRGSRPKRLSGGVNCRRQGPAVKSKTAMSADLWLSLVVPGAGVNRAGRAGGMSKHGHPPASKNRQAVDSCRGAVPTTQSGRLGQNRSNKRDGENATIS